MHGSPWGDGGLGRKQLAWVCEGECGMLHIYYELRVFSSVAMVDLHIAVAMKKKGKELRGGREDIAGGGGARGLVVAG